VPSVPLQPLRTDELTDGHPVLDRPRSAVFG